MRGTSCILRMVTEHFPAKMPPYDTAFIFMKDDYRDVDVPPWAIKLILDTQALERERTAEAMMNIKQAKQEIVDTVQAYLLKDEYGEYVIPRYSSETGADSWAHLESERRRSWNRRQESVK